MMMPILYGCHVLWVSVVSSCDFSGVCCACVAAFVLRLYCWLLLVMCCCGALWLSAGGVGVGWLLSCSVRVVECGARYRDSNNNY